AKAGNAQSESSVPRLDTHQSGRTDLNFKPTIGNQVDEKWNEFLERSPTKTKFTDIEPNKVIQLKPIVNPAETIFQNEWNQVPGFYKRKLHDAAKLYHNGYWKESADALVNLCTINHVFVSTKIRMLCLDDCISIFNWKIHQVCEKDFEGLRAFENPLESIEFDSALQTSLCNFIFDLVNLMRLLINVAKSLNFRSPRNTWSKRLGVSIFAFTRWCGFLINSPPTCSNIWLQLIESIISISVHQAEQILDFFAEKTFTTWVGNIGYRHFALEVKVSSMPCLLAAMRFHVPVVHVKYGIKTDGKE
ncbi:hypothetical protein HDU76_012022, partial [Blyttiomyces sp. JEL0837]